MLFHLPPYLPLVTVQVVKGKVLRENTCHLLWWLSSKFDVCSLVTRYFPSSFPTYPFGTDGGIRWPCW